MSKQSGFEFLEFDQTYDPGVAGVDVVENFYSPVLREAVQYDRAAGYFSSRVFASVARGIAGIVEKRGKIRLVTSHAFTPSDTKNLQDYFADDEFASKLFSEFEDSYSHLGDVAGAIAKDHVAAMCWMLREGLLEIKIIVPIGADLTALSPAEIDKFHPKFGILTDEFGQKIAFSGSVNETESAWNRNIENIDIYREWVEGQAGYVAPKIRRFENYWNNENLGGWACIDLPSAVKDKIVSAFAPEDFPTSLSANVDPTSLPGGLRPYQLEAVESWKRLGRRGFLEMATGTGKTRTAKHCIQSCYELGKILTLVVVPYKHIGDQWVTELAEIGARLIEGDWKSEFSELLLDADMGRFENLTLVVVKNTASKPDFVSRIEELSSSFNHTLLVGDEVHWLGATAFQAALLPFADFRLGLSATPERYFDEEGTGVLYRYFGETAYSFDITRALAYKTPAGEAILTPYEYHPRFVSLSEDEMTEYRLLSKKIASIMGSSESKRIDSDQLEALLIKRSNISKSASAKIPALREVLLQFSGNLTQCLIYCSDFNQMESAGEVLSELGIDAQRITGRESASKSAKYGNISERQHIIDNFAKGNLDVLLAIDCLDEGVDIPSARVGIILASSGNAKEFIQRRGRLMRTFPGKQLAQIFDICVLPNDNDELIKSIRDVELKRIEEFAKDAINELQVLDETAFLRGEE
ncbi:superfamily II DNA or RNA helicase [Aurantimicrobium minutum]|uniref:DEAD/DEAH box helicase family protein n=1 Tax=Aurantimicrobium minutum TaxID=708131 RepID=UPI0024754FA5|nr:DEAD/DEAH box helicase family protein [Aurantimicrobium minutum]MDH6532362.1 superfamily II DNA or RNA helicase [Aurantimicrobium minutum]